MARPARLHEEDRLVEACLATLRSLGPNVTVRLERRHLVKARTDRHVDGELHLSLGPRSREETFVIEVKRTHLSYALAAGLIERARASKQNYLLMAPYVPSTIGQDLAAGGLSYVDPVGNCHIQSSKGRALLAHVEGKKPNRALTDQGGGRVPSHQVNFAILAQPSLLDEPVRQIAAKAGVGKTAAAAQLKRLADRQLIRRSSHGASVLRQRELLDRWLSAYADVVRPAWLLGRYQTQTTDPEQLEQQIERILGNRVWAFGGGAAAWRMARFYRGPETVLHVGSVPPDLPRLLRAIPAQDGALTILRTPGTVPYAGVKPHLAHPLLVYSEMVASGDLRMAEAANEVRERFLVEQS